MEVSKDNTSPTQHYKQVQQPDEHTKQTQSQLLPSYLANITVTADIGLFDISKINAVY
jgi:hypothetical protein